MALSVGSYMALSEKEDGQGTPETCGVAKIKWKKLTKSDI
jgi:hypothetical protein